MIPKIVLKKLFDELKNDLGKQYLLSLLYDNNQEPINGKTRLMKELFFISLNVPSLEKIFEFEADNYGPNSDVIMGYLEDMSQMKLITAKHRSQDNNTIYSIGEYGKKFLEQEQLNLDYDLISEMKELCHGITNDELLALTYFSFPEMTEESLIKDKIWAKREKLALGLYEKGKVSLEKAVEISGLNYGQFMNLLKSKNIKVELLI
ncbi:UPF0175 family protein [uncultured Methanobrevibacter sp.]|uniref:UPF0175 family protein n=1 Tax=uncultured Methanobrevibacter sp. TaxID=253161 RepID=UPI0025F5DE50|nr:UPF0175 family protein [uncultured Methanobrevibacter sp.]